MAQVNAFNVKLKHRVLSTEVLTAYSKQVLTPGNYNRSIFLIVQLYLELITQLLLLELAKI